MRPIAFNHIYHLSHDKKNEKNKFPRLKQNNLLLGHLKPGVAEIFHLKSVEVSSNEIVFIGSIT